METNKINRSKTVIIVMIVIKNDYNILADIVLFIVIWEAECNIINMTVNSISHVSLQLGVIVDAVKSARPFDVCNLINEIVRDTHSHKFMTKIYYHTYLSAKQPV